MTLVFREKDEAAAKVAGARAVPLGVSNKDKGSSAALFSTSSTGRSGAAEGLALEADDTRSVSPLTIMRAPGAQTDGTRHAIVNADAEDSVESSTDSETESTRSTDPDATSIVSELAANDKKYANAARINYL